MDDKSNNTLKTIDSYWIRGLFILPLGLFGLLHFYHPEYYLYMVPEFVGPPLFWVYFSGVALMSTSISIFFKFFSYTTNLLLVLFVITFILFVDIRFIILNEKLEYFFTSLLKDFSLLGGTLIYLVISKSRAKID